VGTYVRVFVCFVLPRGGLLCYAVIILVLGLSFVTERVLFSKA
jgi:hypothetical protein